MTGGTGFIGSHTVELLLKEGHHVVCAIRPQRKERGWLSHLPIDVVSTDLLDASILRSHLRDVEYIFHIAGVTKARTRNEYRLGNVQTTKVLLDVASQLSSLQKFCLVSSLTAAGPSADGTPLVETAPCRPVTEYGRSKFAAEQIAHQFRDKVPLVILRPPAVYGPRDRDILELFVWIRRGLLPTIGKPGKTLSLIHGIDLARGIIAATFHPHSTGKTYFIAEETVHKYEDLVTLASSIIGRKAISVRIPTSAVFLLATFGDLVSLFNSRTPVLNRDRARDLVQRHWVCSPARIRQDIGFRTDIPIDEGLKETYEWYRHAGWL